MPSGRFSLLAGLLFIYSAVCVGGTVHKLEGKIESPPKSQKRGLHLEVKQVPLEQIFKIIENQTGVQLHVSSMPQKLVSATCAGTTLEVLKCVLGRDVNLIYQYADKSPANKGSAQLAEVWVLNSGLSSQHQPPRDTHHQAICSGTENINKTDEPQLSAEGRIILSSDEIKQLSKLAQSTNPRQRQEALSRLALADQTDDDDGSIREIMEEALQDQDPNVRAQAISGLARRNSSEAAPILTDALHDSDVGVRLMAVSNAGENVYLLELALNDSSQIVRNLAKIKLDQISKINTTQ